MEFVGSSNLPKIVMQPSWNHALVTFNNQNSVLLSMFVPKHKLLCLLHDNRIFAFERKQEIDDASSSSNEQNLLLNLLTTSKYRAMSAMYIIFRLLDNIGLLLIIVLSIINNGYTTPTPENLALFSAIGLEVFYDVMLQTNKYWILERLSIHIGIVLYVVYAGIVVWKNSNGDYKDNELQIVFSILATRFLTFIFEECVDVAIDGELHNDLLKLQRHKKLHSGQNPEGNKIEPLEGRPCSSLFSWSKLKSYMDVSTTVKMPQNVEYRGSFFAWSPKSVFTENVWRIIEFPRWRICVLCFFPFLVALFFLILLILLCLVASFIPIALAYFLAIICCRTSNPGKLREKLREKVISSNFWKELTHF